MAPAKRAAAATAAALFVLLLTNLVASTQGNSFLQAHDLKNSGQHVSRRDVELTLLSELDDLGNPVQLHAIKEDLRVTYAALPKGPHGTLEGATVRYALHRYFVRKHGWYMQGLDPLGDAWNMSSPTSVMETLAPFYIQKIFERRLHGRGLSLHELAVFAATLLDLIHTETVRHLERIYSATQLPTVGSLDQGDADAAVKVWLMEYAVGIDLKGTSLDEYREMEQEVMDIYPAWSDSFLWAEDMSEAHALAQRSQRNPFVEHQPSFDNSAALVKELSHQFGTFQNLECSALKNTLVEMDVLGNGRVPLSEFYAGGLGGGWQFTESTDYLRNLGALDESDSRHLSVVIPNYVNSQSNCLTPSSFYSICCLDECEGLLAHLEQELEAPRAAPERIAHVVSHLPSDTQDAPRNLSVALLSRLHQIADLHEGEVALHGRMFAQWLHHAYPWECHFPHVAGTVSPMTPFEWKDVMGLESPVASDEEMQIHANVELHEQLAMTPEAKLEALPWTEAEELLVGYKQTARTELWKLSATAIRRLAFLFVFGALGVSLVRTTGPLDNLCRLGVGPSLSSQYRKEDRYLV